MKKMLILAVAASFFAIPLIAQNRGQNRASRRQARMSQVVEAVMKDSVSIDIVSVIPLQFDRWDVIGQDFYITIRPDSVFSNMPYLGVSYTAFPGNNNGMVFDNSVTDYTKVKKSDLIEIKFKTRTLEDNFGFTVTIDEKGGAEIFVEPDNKQGITYTGNVRTEPIRRRRR